MAGKQSRYPLALFVVCTLLASLLSPGSALAYGNSGGHPIIATEALKLVSAAELQQYAASVRHGSTDEDETDHVYGLSCWNSVCSTTHFWDADGNHGLGPGGPYDKNKCLWPNEGSDCYANAFMKGRELFSRAKSAYRAGNKAQAYEYLGHIAHLLADVTVPGHAHEDYWPGHDDYETWVEDRYQAVGSVPWTFADAQAAGGLVAMPSETALRAKISALAKSGEATIASDMKRWRYLDLKLYYLFYTADQYGDYFNSPDYTGDSREPYGWVNYTSTGDLRAGYGSFPTLASGQPNRWPSSATLAAPEAMGGYLYVYAIRATASLYATFLAEVGAN